MYRMVQMLMYHAVHILIHREAYMRGREMVLLLGFGVIFWVAGTLWYEWCGPQVFDTTPARYWINFILTPIVTAAICILILRWRHIVASQWAIAMLLIAIPGMIGEAALLSHFSAWMPRMRETSAGRYGAFLFAAYALVLGVAEIVALRAAP
jgi:Family of unknown function (DUF5367)